MKDLLQCSLEFIANNPQAKSDEVPKELRDYWLDTSLNPDRAASSNQSTVFLHALLQYQNSNGISGAIFSDAELSDLYGIWQTILFREDLSERLNMKVDAVKLFDFGSYHQL